MSLLDDRIEKYTIPEVMYQPVFDRCLVYQIPTVESETFTGSSLVKPEATRQREKRQSPRGVLVAMGQKAREILEDHGVHLGHVVWFARMAMWRHEIDATNREFSIIRAGEICGSEDLLGDLKSGSATFVQVENQWLLAGKTARTDPQEWSDQ